MAQVFYLRCKRTGETSEVVLCDQHVDQIGGLAGVDRIQAEAGVQCEACQCLEDTNKREECRT